MRTIAEIDEATKVAYNLTWAGKRAVAHLALEKIAALTAEHAANAAWLVIDFSDQDFAGMLVPTGFLLDDGSEGGEDDIESYMDGELYDDLHSACSDLYDGNTSVWHEYRREREGDNTKSGLPGPLDLRRLQAAYATPPAPLSLWLVVHEHKHGDSVVLDTGEVGAYDKACDWVAAEVQEYVKRNGGDGWSTAVSAALASHRQRADVTDIELAKAALAEFDHDDDSISVREILVAS